MGKRTGIPWCDHTYNGWMGCTKVSAGCKRCYAETERDTRYQQVKWGGPRKRTSPATRAAPLKWDTQAQKDGVRRRVFCMSLGDFFGNQVPTEWRDETWETVASVPI
jgi:protein gp37